MENTRCKKLTVTGFSHTNKHHVKHWFCVCDCGITHVKRQTSIKSGEASCDCDKKKQYEEAWKKSCEVRTLNIPHKRKLKNTRSNMIARCYDQKNKRYNAYGGRGIKVTQEWIDNPMSFYNWCLQNGYEGTLQIDRINNDGDYTPENCRLVTQTQNIRNTSRNKYLEANGETLCLSEWAIKLKTTTKKIIYWLGQGKSFQQIVDNLNG